MKCGESPTAAVPVQLSNATVPIASLAALRMALPPWRIFESFRHILRAHIIYWLDPISALWLLPGFAAIADKFPRGTGPAGRICQELVECPCALGLAELA
jgi:hypothetical protein